MCGACYNGIADTAGTSLPFMVAGVAAARARWRNRLEQLRTPAASEDERVPEAQSTR